MEAAVTRDSRYVQEGCRKSIKIGIETSALDESFRAHFHRGIGTYVKELYPRLAALCEKSKDEESKLNSQLTHSVELTRFDHNSLALKPLISCITSLMPFGRQTLSQQLCYPLSLNRGTLKNADLIFFPAHMDAPAWSPLPTVITVLDLIPLKLKELYCPDKVNLRYHFARFLEKSAIKRAKHIIAISECTKRDLIEILGIPSERITVVYIGTRFADFNSTANVHAAKFDEIESRLGITREENYILYVGGIDERKDIPSLVNIFSEFVKNSGNKVSLVLAGKIANDKNYPKLLKQIQNLNLECSTPDTSTYNSTQVSNASHQAKGRVILPGYIDSKSLYSLYRRASLFFFPSRYEGFGLPPLEALASGTPVISTNVSSMPEVLGTFAEYYDGSVGDGAARLKAYFANATKSPYNEVLRYQRYSSDEVRDHVARFSWDNTALKTLEVLISVSNEL